MNNINDNVFENNAIPKMKRNVAHNDYASYDGTYDSFVGHNSDSDTIQRTLKPLFLIDIPQQNELPKSSGLCGYVEPDGTYHKCGSCEHEHVIRQLIWENDTLREKYFETKADTFISIPPGMLQEEYFAMKIMGFAKISSFANVPTQMIVFWYNNLTSEQIDVIYRR